MTNTTRPKRARRFAREPMTAALGVPLGQPDSAQNDAEPPATSAPKQRKTAQVLGLLQRPAGATLDELITTTGWLPHTTRAAMTGLRKKGHDIQRTVIDGVSRYTITAED